MVHRYVEYSASPASFFFFFLNQYSHTALDHGEVPSVLFIFTLLDIITSLLASFYGIHNLGIQHPSLFEKCDWNFMTF